MTTEVEDRRRLEIHRSAFDARAIVVAALAVLVLLAAALTWWVATRSGPDDDRPDVTGAGVYQVGTIDGETSPAVAAAVSAVHKALSYDYRTLDVGLGRAVAAMSPEFAEEFSTTFDRAVRKMAISTKAVTAAVVRGAGLVTSDDSKATVLVYVDQSLAAGRKTSSGASAQVSQSRVVVELERSGNDWLVTSITPL